MNALGHPVRLPARGRKAFGGLPCYRMFAATHDTCHEIRRRASNYVTRRRFASNANAEIPVAWVWIFTPWPVRAPVPPGGRARWRCLSVIYFARCCVGAGQVHTQPCKQLPVIRFHGDQGG